MRAVNVKLKRIHSYDIVPGTLVTSTWVAIGVDHADQKVTIFMFDCAGTKRYVSSRRLDDMLHVVDLDEEK
jgi:hypothetical protein